MTHTWWETVEEKGSAVRDQLTKLLEEGNIRRVRVHHNERIVAEFPLTIGVVGAVFAPVLAAVGAITALLTDCSIEVEREGPDKEEPPSA
jgi:DNA-binding Lrp family transcriptional regulator